MERQSTPTWMGKSINELTLEELQEYKNFLKKTVNRKDALVRMMETTDYKTVYDQDSMDLDKLNIVYMLSNPSQEQSAITLLKFYAMYDKDINMIMARGAESEDILFQLEQLQELHDNI